MSNIKALIDEFADYMRKLKKAELTISYYCTILYRFASSCGNKALEEIKAIDLIRWGETWHHFQAVQRLFRWAYEIAQVISFNPMSSIEKPPLGSRSRILSREEQMRLLRKASFDFRNFLIAMRETIARPQEIRAAKWCDIKNDPSPLTQDELLVQGKCYFRISEYKGKNRRRDVDGYRVIPISPRLGRLIVRIKGKFYKHEQFIFATMNGLPWTNNNARLRMLRLREKAGITKDDNGEAVVCYTFRHTSATQVAAQGVRDRMLADIMGHSTTKMTQRYLHLEPGHMIDALEKCRREARENRKRPKD